MVGAPRVVLYGTGFVAREITKLVTERGWTIVAALNRSGPKIGQDLGTVLGLDRELGIGVEDYEAADYTAMEADIALVAGPDAPEDGFPVYERLLTHGIDVLSCGARSYDPYLLHPEVAKRIDALACEHGATFTGGGLWDMTRIWSGLLCTGASARIDGLDYHSDVEVLRQGAHWAPQLGVGMTQAQFADTVGYEVVPLNQTLQLPARMVLEACGFEITEVCLRQEPVVWEDDVYCRHLERIIPAGHTLGCRTVVDITTQQGVTSQSRFEYRVFRPDEVEHGTWRVHGLPDMELRVVRHDSGIAQAASLLNRVPDVLAARPGIVTVLELGPPRPTTLTGD
jgi:4-hydroxy-tetrahydrodipicolinate reductase